LASSRRTTHTHGFCMRRTEATFLRRPLRVFLGERVGINAAA
jgi:hypothetical protein